MPANLRLLRTYLSIQIIQHPLRLQRVPSANAKEVPPGIAVPCAALAPDVPGLVLGYAWCACFVGLMQHDATAIISKW